MSFPSVSVIMPAYNAEAHLREALRSALDQTYRDLEVIVVDDGSEDRTAEIVREVAEDDDRVVLIQQANAGVAAARNRAIEHARGTYVAPLDADDLWYPEKIERQVRRIERGGEAMGAVYSWWVEVDEDGAIRGSNFPFRQEGDVFWHHIYVNFMGCASVPLIRRSALVAIGGYDASLRASGGQGCEDWDLTLRLAERYAIGVAPGYLLEYRNVEGSMSAAARAMERSYSLVIGKVRRAHPEIPEALFRWSRGIFNGYLASGSYARRDYAFALQLIKDGIRADPALLLARTTTRLIARSTVGLVARPLIDRLWPTRDDWNAFKHRLGFAPSPTYLLGDVEREKLGRGPTPWAEARGPYFAVVARRWAWIAAQPRPERSAVGHHVTHPATA